MMMIAMMILRKGDEHDHLTRDDKNHNDIMIFLQTMYAGKYMNMYGLPGAGGTEQVP